MLLVLSLFYGSGHTLADAGFAAAGPTPFSPLAYRPPSGCQFGPSMPRLRGYMVVTAVRLRACLPGWTLLPAVALHGFTARFVIPDFCSHARYSTLRGATASPTFTPTPHWILDVHCWFTVIPQVLRVITSYLIGYGFSQFLTPPGLSTHAGRYLYHSQHTRAMDGTLTAPLHACA